MNCFMYSRFSGFLLPRGGAAHAATDGLSTGCNAVSPRQYILRDFRSYNVENCQRDRAVTTFSVPNPEAFPITLHCNVCREDLNRSKRYDARDDPVRHEV